MNVVNEESAVAPRSVARYKADGVEPADETAERRNTPAISVVPAHSPSMVVEEVEGVGYSDNPETA